ncbi:H/ACA ribonucleoprotein complex non-core subunit NAF1 isoform X1 [Bactrocera tryoni]|uniref:H/ACA ribonucleoprotein complex non-core subunit NAF1 isoform X1 n=1 Tax=Bactrocera tryoni TaxID=59916 RepID=UPI001A97CA3E|nr:H/ACA ribonucleoprotein complex non-core subunit NAF1 isoform X1 [Bactrocera tryoni]
MDKETIDSNKCIGNEDTKNVHIVSPVLHVSTDSIQSTGLNQNVDSEVNDIEEIPDTSQRPVLDSNSHSNENMELGTHTSDTTVDLESVSDNENEVDEGHVTENVPVILSKAIERRESTNDERISNNVASSNNVIIESVIELTPATTDICDATLHIEANKNIHPDIVEIMGITDKEDNDVQLIEEQPTIPSCEDNDLQLIEEQPTIPSCAGVSKTAAPTGLGLLSQYESDADEDDSNESDTASVIEVPTAVNKNYRSTVVEIDSDSTETVSSDSESETEAEYLTKIAKVIEKRIQSNDDDNEDEDDDDEEGDSKKRGRRQPPRVRGEMLLDELPPIQDLQISVPAEECIELGRVHSIVDQLLLVSALPNSILLDLDTVLFLEKGKRVLGEVFDVLGQVADPLYCVRFNNNQHIQEKGINVGDVVYVAPKTEYTQYVILSSLMKMRGSDASWENDIEPPPRYLDYSDDEEEREARHKLRKHRRQSVKEEEEDKEDVDDKDNDPMKRSRMNGVAGENTTDSQRRHPRAAEGNHRENRRQNRFGQHGAYSPRTYQPQHNTNSWHSHYNQQYQQRPPVHSYRTPYAGPYQQQRPLYRNPAPQPNQFHQYGHPQMQMQAPPSHALPPPQMTPPPPIHAMSPPLQMHPMSHPPTAYVPNPFAFRSSTLSQQFSQPQSTTSIQSPAEPAPPGAE